MVVGAPALEALAEAQAPALNRFPGVASGLRLDDNLLFTLRLGFAVDLNYGFRLGPVTRLFDLPAPEQSSK